MNVSSLLMSIAVLAALHGTVRAEGVKETGVYLDPARYEKVVSAFEKSDSAAPPPAGAIVSIGSSTMRGWNGEISADLAPLTVVPRGFGGSTFNDALHFAGRIVIAYKPRAVLLYEGDNDVALHVPSDTVFARFTSFVGMVRAALPQTRIYVLSVKPSIRRWALWPEMAAFNTRLAAACAADPLLTYIDVAVPMLGADGNPRPEIYKEDNLHMVRAGYDIWRDAVKPVLMSTELQYEKH